MSDKDVPTSWDDEADVIVVGYGFAGAAAGITAHDAGAKVLLLEKAPEEYKGGNSKVSGNAVYWPDDIDKAKTYFKALCGPYMDNISEEMLDVWAKESYANLAWLEGLGAKMLPPVPGHLDIVLAEFPELPASENVKLLVNGKDARPGEHLLIGHERLWQVIESAVSTRPIRTLYDTGATNLIKEGDAIVGVIAQRHGVRLAIKARRGVVLTCGGFENNPEMIRNYLSGVTDIYPVGTPYNTGDGVRMGIEVGADLWHMNNIAGPELFFKAKDIPVAQWINLPHANSYIFVGADGTRFTAEGQGVQGADRHGKVKRHGQWMQQLTPTPIHLIFDENLRKAGGIGKTEADWDLSHGNHYDWSDDNLREIEKGWIKRADTLHELAGLIGLNPKILETTVKRFNASAANKNDQEFGRSPNRMAEISGPPYYAMELTPAFINTQGGPRRDEKARVIGVNGTPIPRLYSAGELGSIYSFLYQGGGNVAECFAFGRVAGRNVSAEIPC